MQKLSDLQAHAAARPRVTPEVLQALDALARAHPTDEIRQLGAALLKYLSGIERWMSEEETLVTALVGSPPPDPFAEPLHALDDLVELAKVWRRLLLTQMKDEDETVGS